MMDRLARQISFFAPAAVMSAWATVMLQTIATGHINRLLSPIFRNYVGIAAVLLLVLSVLYLALYEPSANPAPALAPTGRLRQLGRWFLLLVPLLAASIFSPSALSSTTLANRQAISSTAGAIPMPTWSSTSQKNAELIVNSDASQPVPVELTDLVTLSHSPQQIKAFEGRKVRVVGFMTHPTVGSPRLARWIMWCCAADAQPVSVELGGNTAGDWKDTEWIEAVGTISFPSTLGQVIPHIEVESVKKTDEPDEPYLSP